MILCEMHVRSKKVRRTCTHFVMDFLFVLLRCGLTIDVVTSRPL